MSKTSNKPLAKKSSPKTVSKTQTKTPSKAKEKKSVIVEKDTSNKVLKADELVGTQG